MSLGVFDKWRTICNRLISPRYLPLAFDDCLHLSWEAVERNIGRARRCMLRPGLAQGGMSVEPIALDDSTRPHAPSDDADTPALPPGAPALRPPFC